MRHKASLGLYDYWKRRRRTGAAPHRRDISPAEMQPYLSCVSILERGDSGHFVFRLAGTGVCTLFARELRHSIVTELWHATQAKTTRDVLEAVVAKSRPAVLDGRAVSCRGTTLPLEILFLPLQTEPDGKQWVLAGINLLEHPLWLDTDPVHHFIDTSARLIDPSTVASDHDERTEPAAQSAATIFRSRGNSGSATRLQRLTVIESGKPD